MKNLNLKDVLFVSGGTADESGTYFERIKSAAEKAKSDIDDLVQSALNKVGIGANKAADKINDMIEH